MSDIKLLKIIDFNKEKNEDSFYINTISNHLTAHHSRIEKPHKHNFYAVFLFISGNGTHEIDFQQYDVKPGAVFFLYPGQTHAWELSDDADGYLFFHNEEFYEMAYISNSIKDYPFFESNHTEKCIYLDKNQSCLISDKLQCIYNESLENQWKKTQIILSYLTQTYIYLNRFLVGQKPINVNELKHYQSVFNKFEKILNVDFLNDKSASSYAKKLNISQKHLNRIVKIITGKTTTQIIADRVLLEAKRQLIYTDKTLTEIAITLGYTDYAYFSRLFKKSENMKPSDFRKQYKYD